jgi:hypothetical protein
MAARCQKTRLTLNVARAAENPPQNFMSITPLNIEKPLHNAASICLQQKLAGHYCEDARPTENAYRAIIAGI